MNANADCSLVQVESFGENAEREIHVLEMVVTKAGCVTRRQSSMAGDTILKRSGAQGM
jgi:hypothetical protein